MTIDKQKLQKLLWAEAASFRADCADWKRNTEALQEFLGEKTVEEVALELLAENEDLKTVCAAFDRVNCKVKAENELLRIQASACAKELRKASSWICREVEAGTTSATHWAIRLRASADQIEAAMCSGRPDSRGSEQGQIPTETPIPERSACRSENP